MLAAVVTSAARWNREQSWLTYQVPDELEQEIQIGQLVAVPYRERLVEGIVWLILPDEEGPVLGDDALLRPIKAILDPEPALLPHQCELAQWLAEYYVAPLAHVALLMLSPGMVRRSQFVLRLTEAYAQGDVEAGPETSARMSALLGLLQAEGEMDVEHIKKMLGRTRAKELLKEVKASNLVVSDPQLQAPRAKPRIKRVVRLLAHGEALEEWRERIETQLQAQWTPLAEPVGSVADMSPRYALPVGKRKFDPWALPEAPTPGNEMALTAQEKTGLLLQRQLAAIDLLLQSQHKHSTWSPHALCKASGLTRSQLQRLEREHIVIIEEQEIQRNPLLERSIPVSYPLPLTPAQQLALDAILEAIHDSREGIIPPPILLHGVTGSGKTEVYLQALAAVIEQGKRGLLLIPEIALTTQAVQRVAGRFPNRVAIIHSELSVGERYDEWRRIRSGQIDVVIGSRSALFAPLPDLGIILIDEEHEPAYKQSEFKPTYHARDAALKLGEMLSIPVILGSATPSVETFYQAQQGEYQLVELPARIGADLPPVEIIDLRNELRAGNSSIISRRLQEGLERILGAGQQAILFLNRRGAASCVLCRDCGYVALCERCDIPLTYHATERILLCHYCGQQRKAIQFCPSCHSSNIRYFGLGTEKVQHTIQRNFPDARLLRWDRDTARNRHAHEQLLDRFANREADILIGTQMIAKGLDLPGVTLVGVISADIALNLPDYAAPERAFTLLTQVAGRAGRGTEAGRVIIQTFNPEHFCITTASRHDYHEFYAAEIDVRQSYGYPPFRRFVKFTYSHEYRHRSQNEALLLHERLCEWIERLQLADTDIVGPAPALMERIRGKYRWQMIVRGPDLHRLLRVIDAPGWEIDIDPISAL